MSNETQQQPPSRTIEVMELEDYMLDVASGGRLDLNVQCGCGEPNQGCNSVAGCGGG